MKSSLIQFALGTALLSVGGTWISEARSAGSSVWKTRPQVGRFLDGVARGEFNLRS